jgi:ATP-dependent protease HslVU (ClpYQ) peptidase subunit
MTTIAFDGQYVAADKGIWANGHIDKITKLRVVTIEGEKMIAACMGDAHFSRALLSWMEDNTKPKPDWRSGEKDMYGTTTCIHLFTKHGVILDVSAEGGVLTLEGHGPRGVFAAGGGREMALGALLAGASAQRAVEIAIEFSDYGGHGVTVHSIGEL